MVGAAKSGQRYRLKTPTIACVCRDGRMVAVTIPAGCEILVVDVGVDSSDISQQLSVRWDGQVATMFAVDIRERGEPIGASSFNLAIRSQGEK